LDTTRRHHHPVLISWSEAPAKILSRVESHGSPRLIRVAGPVASGKSTLAARLAAETNALLISTDDYLPDYDITPEHLRDEPDSSHLLELAGHLADLLAGRPADLPVWTFEHHRRTGIRKASPTPVIVVEGIHALHPNLDRTPDDAGELCVFVHAGAKLRRARWEARERAGERGWPVDQALAFFDAVAEPTFARHRAIYEARANLVVINDG
jgi:uridine kinase